MEDKIELVKELYSKAESFAKTNIELYRLKVIDKGTDIFASITSWVIIGLMLLFLILLASLGLAFYLGDVLGKTHYGFFAVAGIYFFVIIILFATRKSGLERFFNDYMVHQIFKEKKS